MSTRRSGCGRRFCAWSVRRRKPRAHVHVAVRCAVLTRWMDVAAAALAAPSRPRPWWLNACRGMTCALGGDADERRAVGGEIPDGWAPPAPAPAPAPLPRVGPAAASISSMIIAPHAQRLLRPAIAEACRSAAKGRPVCARCVAHFLVPIGNGDRFCADLFARASVRSGQQPHNLTPRPQRAASDRDCGTFLRRAQVLHRRGHRAPGPVCSIPPLAARAPPATSRRLNEARSGPAA